VFAPSRSGSDTLYEGDFKALTDLHRLANELGIAIIVIHHTRKMEADDPIDTVSGSLGLTGAAHTVLVLARSPKGTTLYVRGRDVEEGELSYASLKTSRKAISGRERLGP
jgi:RecA-family ATPase